jgi:uncharacterized protein YcsI (UPF0317 family)
MTRRAARRSKASGCGATSAPAASAAPAAGSRPASCNATWRSCPRLSDSTSCSTASATSAPARCSRSPIRAIRFRLAPTADLRTDCARYSVFVDGARQDDRSDLTGIWRDDLVCFLIGSGITFDAALERAGVPTGSDRWVLRTALPTEPAGPFRGNLIVTMRWLTPGQAITATQVTARFPFNHGAPIHIGDPAAIGADLASPMFGGPVPALPPDRVPVFWACGVTPQAAAEAARLPLFIAHAAAHSFITDRTADSVMLP